MKPRFVFDQLRFLFQTLRERRGWQNKCAIVKDAALLVRRCRRLARAMREPAGELKIGGQTCTEIGRAHV